MTAWSDCVSDQSGSLCSQIGSLFRSDIIKLGNYDRIGCL